MLEAKDSLWYFAYLDALLVAPLLPILVGGILYRRTVKEVEGTPDFLIPVISNCIQRVSTIYRLFEY
jgi:hypothetical protein